MKKAILPVFCLLLLFPAATRAQGLFISQYVDTESGTTPKGIEVVNNTGSALDFSATPLVINRYANDNTSPTEEANVTTGTLADGAVLVIGGSDLQTYMQRAHPSIRFVNESFRHNGNDALEVLLGDTRQDLFGMIGPGTGPWSGNGVSSEDQNIAVNDDVTMGEPDGFTDPSTRFSTVTEGPTGGSNADLMGFGVAPALNGGGGGGGGGDPTVQFTAGSATVSEGDGSAVIGVSLLNADGNSASVDVVFDGDASSAGSSDVGDYQTQTVTFDGSADDAVTVMVELTDDDEQESTETARFSLANATGADLGSPSSYDLSIEDNEAPDPIDIAEARSRENGTLVSVEGTVTRTEGDFTRIQDATGGLTIRQTAGAPDPAFKDSVTSGAIRPGTEVRVTGTLSEFNFLKQINSDDTRDDLRSFEILSQGNELPDPQIVTLQEIKQNGEDYESELIRVENLALQTPDETYAAAKTYENLSDATLSDGSVSLRIPNATDTEVEGATVLNSFTFVGVLSQYNFVDNPDVGYQILPVAASDVRAAGGDGTTRLRFNAAGDFVAENRDSANVSVVIANPGDEATSVTVERTGDGTATEGEDFDAFSAQTLTFSANQNTQSVTFTLNDDSTSEGDETITLALTSVQGGEAELGTPATFTLTLVDDEERAVLPGKQGASLREALAADYEPATLGYGVARDKLFGDLFNRQDTVRGFYTGAQVYIDPKEDPTTDAFDKNFNTEHAWPRSKGAEQEPARSNLHILFPTRAPVNSARNNLPYDEIPDAQTGTWYYLNQEQQSIPTDNIDRWSESASGRFEPRESVKGDVARAVFYFNAIYPDRADDAFFEKQRDVLYGWHQQDPAGASEKRRNARIAAYQDGKVNPFVTDPSLVKRAFFTTVATEELARPAAFALHGNAPNPVATSTTLHFDLPEAARVTVAVYDVMGRRVLETPARSVSAGPDRTLTLRASDLPAGVYVYRLTARTGPHARTTSSGALTVAR